jgi:molybdenum cofactor guanylyltransferase
MSTTSKKLHGLILAGGRSRRMGQDKALLKYQGKAQVDVAYDLLTQFCDKVFVSTRPDQSSLSAYQHLPQLHDLSQYSEMGPLGGIASALTTYPDSAWLVLACDLPFVTKDTIDYLIRGRNPQKIATAFLSSGDQLPEPLCAIWEPFSLEQIVILGKEGIKCPRKVLIKSSVELLVQQDPKWLDNVNTAEEFNQAIHQLKH